MRETRGHWPQPDYEPWDDVTRSDYEGAPMSGDAGGGYRYPDSEDELTPLLPCDWCPNAATCAPGGKCLEPRSKAT